jgi:hypothetical protein
MILDERLEFADATALNTGAAGTYLVGDVIDTYPLGTIGVSPLNSDLSGGADSLWLVVGVDTAATSGGSATLQIQLASDAQAAIATDGSATVHFASAVIPVASLVAGFYVARVMLPIGTYERYIGILQVTGTAAFTAGKINAFLTNDVAAWKPYADAVN